MLAKIPAEVLDKFYGCGAPLPAGINGLTVLDLGSGSGRDCYAAAALVGEHGAVIGVDMTPGQLQVLKCCCRQDVVLRSRVPSVIDHCLPLCWTLGGC